ncbi:Helicase, putative [Hondaea fermentalgiana]|uniref:Helicase, putative n=1 Tax=Hondaea fermentalgiana TaxID=2315210 RepID=A0A2R5GFT8_9STRA|nr:Helicase, putative [Hondaea fermentalgiana]|eukprot:GBG27503.1 Helicase, putative [Hondaea fermentalgiana]
MATARGDAGDDGVRVEYSKSGRSACRGRACGKPIQKDELRVCETYQQRVGGAFRTGTRFFHLDCFPQARWARMESVAMDGLHMSDNLEVLKRLGGRSSAAASSTPAKSKAKTRAKRSDDDDDDDDNSTSKATNATDEDARDRFYDARLLPPAEASKALVSPTVGLEQRFVDMLMPFQKQGVAFAVQQCKGRVLIGDEMGLGKTVQAIGFALAFRSEWPLLIVAPSSVKLNWADELEQWAPSLQPGDINVVKSRSFPGDLDKPVTIITYGMFARGSKVAAAIEARKFGVVVVDESHYLKSSSALRTKMLAPVLKAARRVALLSGTPALARPIELWTQVHALRPDLFPQYTAFTRRFCKPTRRPWGMDLNGASNLEELHERLQGLLVRRQKRNVLRQLPPKRRQFLRLDIAPNSPAMKEVKDLREQLRNVDMSSIMAAVNEGGVDREIYREAMSKRTEQRTTLMKLYKATGAAKVQAAADYVCSTAESAGKLIVFAHHLAVLDDLQTALTRKKVNLIRIDGSVSTADRHAHVKRFQDPDSKVSVALLGLTSAGQGITLTAASTVVFVEMHWTPGVLVQAEDRAHRIGQVNAVNIVYLYGKGTLDDIVWPMVRRKLDTVGKALDGDRRQNMLAQTDKTTSCLADHVDTTAGDALEDETASASASANCNETNGVFPKGDVRTWFSPAARPLAVQNQQQEKQHRQESESTVAPTTPRALTTTTTKRQRENGADTPHDAATDAVPSPVIDLTPLKRVRQGKRATPETRSESIVMDLTMSNDAWENADKSVLTPKIEKESSSNDHSTKKQDKKESNKKESRENSGRKMGKMSMTRSPPPSARALINDADLHDEIEDEMEDEPAPSPLAAALHFSVSGNTGRIFLFDGNKEPLGINLTPDRALDGKWDGAPPLPSLIRDDQAVQIAIQRFARQWRGLRAAEQSALADRVLRPPLLPLVQELHAKRSAQGLCFDRYIARPAQNADGAPEMSSTSQDKDSNPTSSESNGPPHCLECEREIPADLVKLQVTTLCSYECATKYRVKLGSSAIRRQLFSLEHGVCQLCSENAQALYEKIKSVTSAERYQMLVGSKFKPTKQRLENPRAGDFWQADHIHAVALGGGQASMLNFRTLCCPCHERETKALMRALRGRKLEEAAQGSRDIRGFFAKSTG